jgi:putative glutamine amidotransferase
MHSLHSWPLVGVPACRKFVESHPFHAVGEKYLSALTDASGVVPVIVPALGACLPPETLLARLDGLMLTGSVSNVEPRHYAGPASRPGTLHDPHRDATTLPLLRAALSAGIPVLAICRGHQELNVAFGGTLHQQVQEVAGLTDHREPDGDSLDSKYAPVHDVSLTPGGVLAALAEGLVQRVNSLHQQGVDRLGEGLQVEAVARDGLIEAVSAPTAPGFVLGVQWHPEWQVMATPFYRAIFGAFGDACRSRAAARKAA